MKIPPALPVALKKRESVQELALGLFLFNYLSNFSVFNFKLI